MNVKCKPIKPGLQKQNYCQGNGLVRKVLATQVNLSLTSRAHVEKLDEVVHTFQPSSGEAVTGGSQGLSGQPT